MEFYRILQNQAETGGLAAHNCFHPSRQITERQQPSPRHPDRSESAVEDLRFDDSYLEALSERSCTYLLFIFERKDSPVDNP
jgi:hypothetical protein